MLCITGASFILKFKNTKSYIRHENEHEDYICNKDSNTKRLWVFVSVLLMKDGRKVYKKEKNQSLIPFQATKYH